MCNVLAILGYTSLHVVLLLLLFFFDSEITIRKTRLFCLDALVMIGQAE